MSVDVILLRWRDLTEEGDAKQEKGCSVKKRVIKDENPILWSAQQGYTACTKLLHQHGFRIPQVRGEAIFEGERETVRQKEVMKAPGDDDHVAKFLTFDAYASPHYLALGFTEDPRIDDPRIGAEDLKDLDRLDPLRRAFKLAEKAEEFEKDRPGASELAKNFAAIEKNLDKFSRGILNQCSDMDEVKTILSHKPYGKDQGKSLEANAFTTSLMEGRKEFVSHPFYQQYLWKLMIGDSTSKNMQTARNRLPKVVRPFWPLLYGPYVLLLFVFYPFIIFFDFFRNADILFVSRKELKKKNRDDNHENWLFSHFRGRIHTPIHRMYVYGVIQIVYLALLVILVWDPVTVDIEEDCASNNTMPTNEPNESEAKTDPFTLCTDNTKRYELHGYTYGILVLTGILVFDGLLKFFTKDMRFGSKQDFFETFWTPFNLCSRLLLFSGTIAVVVFHEDENRANLSGNHPVNIGHTFMSIGIGAEALKVMRFLVQFERFGTLVICVVNVLKIVVRIIPIYIVLFSGFGLSMWSMLRPFQTPEAQNNATQYYMKDKISRKDRSFFHVLFWRIIYADGPDKMFIERNYTWNNTKFEGPKRNFSMEFSHLMPMALWGIYQVTVIILMLNLLIAIMVRFIGFNFAWFKLPLSLRTSLSTMCGRPRIRSGSTAKAFIR